MSIKRKLRLYLVVGETSGDILAADLIDNFIELGVDVELIGLGGPKLRERGMVPLFESSQIAVMGLTGVIRKLPSIMSKARQVAKDVVDKKPDLLLLIDSPEFAKQVAKRVKSEIPDLPIVKYVCPTVWSWRPGRAANMKSYVDHVLAILPFEPDVMKELGGPSTTYVGHPLARLAGKIDLDAKYQPNEKAEILLLPGSRKSEISKLLPVLSSTIEVLSNRNIDARFLLPAVDHLEDEIRNSVKDWPIKPEIIIGEEKRIAAMQRADAAIAASGTAILELAMYGVPTVSIYKIDRAIYLIRFLIKAWTAALPNLIADKVIVPERINEFAHPHYIARLIEPLIEDSLERKTQIEGFKLVHKKMEQDEAPGRKCANILLELADL